MSFIRFMTVSYTSRTKRELVNTLNRCKDERRRAWLQRLLDITPDSDHWINFFKREIGRKRSRLVPMRHLMNYLLIRGCIPPLDKLGGAIFSERITYAELHAMMECMFCKRIKYLIRHTIFCPVPEHVHLTGYLRVPMEEKKMTVKSIIEGGKKPPGDTKMFWRMLQTMENEEIRHVVFTETSSFIIIGIYTLNKSSKLVPAGWYEYDKIKRSMVDKL